MLQKFKSNLINNFSYQSKLFSFPIPILCVEPENLTDKSVIYIFNTGLGGTNKWSEFMCFPLFKNNYFISYEKAGHGFNKNKPSQYKRKTLLELQEVILFIHNKYPKRRIFLLGESWGSSINLLYLKKYGHKYVEGTVNWNMPSKPIAIDKRSFFQYFLLSFKIILTFLFNLNFKDNQRNFVQDKLSQNTFLVRAQRLVGSNQMNLKLPICSWRFMKPSWRFLFKNINNPKYNFLYLQSGQDALMNLKGVNKLNKNYKNSKKYFFLETGFHILAFEPKENVILYREIERFVNK